MKLSNISILSALATTLVGGTIALIGAGMGIFNEEAGTIMLFVGLGIACLFVPSIICFIIFVGRDK